MHNIVVFWLWITYQVAVMNLAMSFDYFSAYNNKVIVDPAMDFTVEELYLGWLSTILTAGHIFPQAMCTLLDMVIYGYSLRHPRKAYKKMKEIKERHRKTEAKEEKPAGLNWRALTGAYKT